MQAPMSAPMAAPAQKKSSTTTILLIVGGVFGAVLVCCCGGGVAGYFVIQKQEEEEKTSTTLYRLSDIRSSIEAYRAEFGRCPPSLNELSNTRYVTTWDGWVNDFNYTCDPLTGNATVYSSGPDQLPGTPDDIH